MVLGKFASFMNSNPRAEAGMALAGRASPVAGGVIALATLGPLAAILTVTALEELAKNVGEDAVWKLAFGSQIVDETEYKKGWEKFIRHAHSLSADYNFANQILTATDTKIK